jgi:subtilase family serine protease
MRISDLSYFRLLWLYCCLIFVPIAAWSQTASTQSRIVERVDETALVPLRGNTHPWAQPQFDRGAAPPDLPMARMLLVLKRSDAQELALEALLDAQQDPNSSSYHQWLTPDAFGQQYGPSDQDIQAVSTWLQSHGFQVARIARGRTMIEFSGSAAQVQQAFHTGIHKYTVNGVNHWANASDPQIPQALAPVIAGVNSMHNFQKTPAHHVAGVFSRSSATGKVKAIQPGFTIPNSNFCAGTGDCYLLGPYDFATIYNTLPLWNAGTPIDGTGQNIAIIGRSNIVLQDVREFRSLFGLQPKDPNIIVDGTDPGLVSGDETEADLDVEWSGAVAKGATINFVVSASTEATDGVDLSAVYAVENNVAPVVSESFLQCELFLGTTGNIFANALREQAAAQGITFLTAAGDQGAAGCDALASNSAPPAPATFGLMVNGLASSPYGVAVGGTDFLNFGPSYTAASLNMASPYWNTTNDTHQASAKGYVPESTWNSTCTNNIFVVLGLGNSAEANCNNAQLATLVDVVGAGGGKSNCITSDGVTAASCGGGYVKPSWQSAPGVPADGARDIPDVSLFASSGFLNSAYIVCEADQTQTQGTCGLTGIDVDFLGVGGTSASTPAFAGIMAMVNQFTQSTGQGNANHVFYKLASSSTQTNANCNSSSTTLSATCIFNDVTSGTIAMPCAAKSPNCNLSTGSDAYGVLSGYNTTAGYDLATGLGSVNAFNLIHAWPSAGTPTTTTLTLGGGSAVNITHGAAVNFTIAVAPGAATGDVSLLGSPTSGNPVAMGEFTLQSGSASGTTTSLAGGTAYQVKAHYAGDGTFASSDSAPVTVTVAPEPSTTLISIPVFNPTNGNETSDTPASLVYGSPYILRVDVGNANAKVTLPMKPVCAQLTCPTGRITLSDSVSGGATGVFALNAQGYTEDSAIQLGGGTHQISASYPGDNSYNASTGAYTLTVTPSLTQLTVPTVPGPVVAGTQYSLSGSLTTNVLQGATPTGTMTFFDGATAISGTATLNGQPGTTTSGATLNGSILATFTTSGSHSITAKYSGDPNYAASTSAAATFSVFYPTTAVESAASTTINLGQSDAITATATSSIKTPPMTGTFQFSLGNAPVGLPVPGVLGMDASGNQVLTATFSASPASSQFVTAVYSGDSNYEQASASILINVVIPDFSLTIPASPFLISAGQPGSLPVTIAPASTMSSAVMLSCGGNLPVGYNCGVSPATQTLSNGASTTVMLNLTPITSGSSSAAKRAGLIRQVGSFSGGPVLFAGLSFLTVLVSLILLGWTARPLRWRVSICLILLSTVGLALGCGSGSSTGSGGGGGGSTPTVKPTSTSVASSAAKVAASAQVTLTATITGENTPTGSVNFAANGNLTLGSANLVGNTASLTTTIPFPGIYTVVALYSGDTLNNPSTSAGLAQGVTGTTVMDVEGQTSTLTHFTNVTITIQ